MHGVLTDHSANDASHVEENREERREEEEPKPDKDGRVDCSDAVYLPGCQEGSLKHLRKEQDL